MYHKSRCMKQQHCQYQIATGVPINEDIYCSSTVVQQIENHLSELAVKSQCIIHYQDSIAIGVPINVNKCCSSTVVYVIEKRSSERAVQSQCFIRCQGSIAIGVPVNVDICCSLRSSGIGVHWNRCSIAIGVPLEQVSYSNLESFK